MSKTRKSDLERLLIENEISSEFLLKKVEKAKKREFGDKLSDSYKVSFSYIRKGCCYFRFTPGYCNYDIFIKDGKIIGLKSRPIVFLKELGMENGMLIFTTESGNKISLYLMDNYTCFIGDEKFQLIVSIHKTKGIINPDF